MPATLVEFVEVNRNLVADVTIPANRTFIQHDLVLEADVEIVILNTGELLLL